MGNDRHRTNKITHIKLQNKQSTFYVVPNNFPLIEDGLIGLPFLNQYNYRITNDTITLDDTTIHFQKDKEIAPGQTEIHTTYLEGKPTRVCFFNTGKQVHHISNEIEKNHNSSITELKDAIRTQHIESAFREPIEKILISYKDVFNLDTTKLPCTNLTEHTITLKSEKPINTKSYRPPECHKKEIERQINEMLERKVYRL